MRIGRRRVAARSRPWTELLYRTRGPAELLLTASLRSVARRQPDAFDRLGSVRDAVIRIAPDDLPIAFEMRSEGVRGSVRVVRPNADASVASACIRGPILTLLTLFDGRGDADGAFFQRRIDIDGDTAAILALHNALEASELTVADILGLPQRLDPVLQTALSIIGRLRRNEARP